jgi:DNA-binding transcriptional regulator LsrR (DeoR family)
LSAHRQDRAAARDRLPEYLEQLENVAAVACGQSKTQAILGALRTGILDYLIIDDRTALEVMKS